MSPARRRRTRRRLRVLVLLETGRRPPDDLDALTDQERYDFKMEIDVLTTLRALGHEARLLEVRDELGPIREMLNEWKPHVVFNLIEAFFVNAMNGFPARHMKVIGVTGTNGKTTTTFMIHRMLQDAGYNTAIMTTVAWGIGDDIEYQVQHYTNVPIRQLMGRLIKLKKAKIDYLVMEITCQALAQNRAWGVPFEMAVMTNVTHEHLDYHKTFERYRDAKRKQGADRV